MFSLVGFYFLSCMEKNILIVERLFCMTNSLNSLIKHLFYKTYMRIYLISILFNKLFVFGYMF